MMSFSVGALGAGKSFSLIVASVHCVVAELSDFSKLLTSLSSSLLSFICTRFSIEFVPFDFCFAKPIFSKCS